MNRLKELRQEKKLSQKEIALELQVPPRTYQRWENGESQIKPDKAQQLADYFGVSVGYLLGYSEDFFSKETKKLDDLLNRTLTLEDGTPLTREDVKNIVLETEDDETLLKVGKLKLIAIAGQAPADFWNKLGNDVFRMIALAPSDYVAIISLWALLSEQQRKSVLNLLQSFDIGSDNQD